MSEATETNTGRRRGGAKSGIERKSAFFYNGVGYDTKEEATNAKARESLQVVMSQQPGDVEILDFMIQNAGPLAEALKEIARAQGGRRRRKGEAAEGGEQPARGRRRRQAAEGAAA